MVHTSSTSNSDKRLIARKQKGIDPQKGTAVIYSSIKIEKPDPSDSETTS